MTRSRTLAFIVTQIILNESRIMYLLSSGRFLFCFVFAYSYVTIFMLSLAIKINGNSKNDRKINSRVFFLFLSSPWFASKELFTKVKVFLRTLLSDVIEWRN